jgi:hypothetical protein
MIPPRLATARKRKSEPRKGTYGSTFPGMNPLAVLSIKSINISSRTGTRLRTITIPTTIKIINAQVEMTDSRTPTPNTRNTTSDTI